MKQFPPFRLDPVNQCVWRQKRPDQPAERVSLGPKAFAVLRYLVEHPQQLVTHRELLQALWTDSVVQPQVVKSHILEIRTALGDCPKKPLFIETLPRRGYQFIAPVSEAHSPNGADHGESAGSRLVGRNRALSELADCLDRALKKRRQIVFITGEPGIGKTTLTDEFARQAADPKRFRIARGQCIEGYGGKEAYYPMLEALGQLCRAGDGGAVVEILARHAPTWLVQFPALLNPEQREVLQRDIQSATRERMLREMGDALEIITASKPLILIFEDLHWVDNSTVDLISALARRRAPAQLMLIGTYRPVEVALSEHPLKAVEQDLLVHRLCREIALEPLNELQIRDYLAAESSSELVADGMAAMVYRHSEGNPLFMVAALHHLTERGLISRRNGGWQLRCSLEDIELEVPENLRKMIDAQIDRLPPDDRRALEVAAITGVSFSPGVSAAVAGLDQDRFEDLCDRLWRRHRLVRPIPPQQLPDGGLLHRYEFVHALYREVLDSRVPPSRRAKLHLAIGDCLEKLWSQRPEAVAAELAHHFERAQEWHRAIGYLRLVAANAAKRYAPRQAAAVLEHALELAGRLPQGDRAQCETQTLLELASIYFVTLDARTIETYEALASRAARYRLFDVELRALIDMIYPVGRVSSQRCLEIIERALRVAEHCDPLTQARARANCLVRRVWVRGWNARDVEDCEHALAEIRRSGDRLALASHLIDYGFIQWMSSQYREAKRTQLESLAILDESGEENPYLSLTQWESDIIFPWFLLFLGQWGEALRRIEASIAIVERNQDAHRTQVLRLYSGWVNLQAMDFAGALAIFEAVLPFFRDPGRASWRRYCLTFAGGAEAGLGNYSRALERLRMVLEEMNSRPVMADWYCRIILEAYLAEVWLAMGNLAEARAGAKRLLELSLGTAERTWQTLAWELNARVAMADLDFEQAQKSIGQALSIAGSFEVPLADWRAHATAAELYGRVGNTGPSHHHRRLSASAILKLADSMKPDEPLRHKFLSASAVRRVLAPESLAPGV